MQRRPTTQDITWLLDLHQNKQLDLEPPYQRRSVWTRKDKQFFLDTIFRNYPSPAIFLHKTIDHGGKATYHVVDGKQRTQTILDFAKDAIRIAGDFGDVRLDGKKWSELQGETALKQRFWNYQITVEMIDIVEGTVVNEVFARLNRNSRKLTAQELRHAKFEGWLISNAEAEAELADWRTLGVVSPARAKRMLDTQFISELMLVLLEGRVIGFDQDAMDNLYAKYDDPAETELNQDAFLERFTSTKKYLLEVNDQDSVVSKWAKGLGHFYALWSAVALVETLPAPATLAHRYAEFMQKVQTLAGALDLEDFLKDARQGEYTAALSYLTNTRGASTDLGPRKERLSVLQGVLFS